MGHFVGAGIFWINLNHTDLGCWRLTLSNSDDYFQVKRFLLSESMRMQTLQIVL